MKELTTWKTAVLTVGIFAGLYTLSVGQHQGDWKAHQIIGFAIMAPSLALWALARLQLGRSFSGRAEARELVTHGLYSRIRNPIYLFGGLAVVGLFVFFGSPYLFFLLFLLIPLQLVRIRNESRVLQAAFGNTYRDYKQRTWF